MFDSIAFQSVGGMDASRRIQLLALSTCGFCRRGQEFLEKHGLAYEYVHLDTLDASFKVKAKEEFKAAFGVALSYPALVIDGKAHAVGYVRRFWEALLNIPHEEEASEVEILD